MKQLDPALSHLILSSLAQPRPTLLSFDSLFSFELKKFVRILGTKMEQVIPDGSSFAGARVNFTLKYF